jgi:micrococcal nuclease
MKAKQYIFLPFLILFILLAGCDELLLELEADAPPEAPVVVQPIPAGERATVARIIDGDTIDVLLADGRRERVRYIGVDTPERDEPFYAEAMEANRRLIEGQELILAKDVSETDRFGRLLRYVYLSDGLFVNAELVRQGYARVVTFPPDVAEIDGFLVWQQDARGNRRGLWANE